LLDMISWHLWHNNVVFIVGAGCSAEPPSEFPVADELAYRIAYGDQPSSQAVRDKYGSPEPNLEHVAETVIREPGGMHRFMDLLRAAVSVEMANDPNPAHHALAHMAAEGFLTEIITTNIDKYIDVALVKAGLLTHPIRHAGELGYSNSTAWPVHYYKVHGDLDLAPELLMVTREQLAKGLEWVQSALLHLTQMHYVVFVGYSGAVDYVNETVGVVLQRIQQRRCYLVGREAWADVINVPPTNRLVELCCIEQEAYDDRGAGKVLEDILHKALLREWRHQLSGLAKGAHDLWGSSLPRDELDKQVQVLQQHVDDLSLRSLQDMAWLLLLLWVEAKYVGVRPNHESLLRVLKWRLKVAIECKSDGVADQPALLRTEDGQFILVIDAHDLGPVEITSRLVRIFGDDRGRGKLERLGAGDSTTVMITGQGEDIELWDYLRGSNDRSRLLGRSLPRFRYVGRSIDSTNAVARRKADGSA